MPNAFAFLVVFSWPVVVFFLFRFLPRTEALGWSILGGYLLLPTRAGLDLPLIPLIDKDAIPALAATVLLAFGMGAAGSSSRQLPGGLPTASRDHEARGALAPMLPFLVILIVAPIITVLTNSEPLFFGPVVLPGLRIYDALSIIARLGLTVLPFLLAVKYFASPKSHAALLKIIVVGMLVYSLPALFEVRMSPQLNVMLYGFFPHEFAQHIRAGGFRPVVFLHHGLWLGILLAMAIIAATALWRQRLSEGGTAGHWLFAAIYLLLVLFLAKSLGAFALAMILVPAVLFLGVRGQVLVAGLISVIVLLYPVLRSTDLVPVDSIVRMAERVSPERAASLQFRLDNEDVLTARAAEKPLAGWGIWGRNQIYDPESGRSISVTDGAWVIVIGIYGWLGYISQFGMLTLPALLLAFGRKSSALTPATAGLSLVMAVNLLDLLPNATMTPITWLIGGALAGYCAYRAPLETRDEHPLEAGPKRSWSVLTDRPRQLRPNAKASASSWRAPSRAARRTGREDI